MYITAIYAAISALLVVALSFRVIRLRLSTRTGIGDGGHQDLARCIRAHANALENLPLALLLLLCLELRQTSPLWLHGFGSTLIVARVMHAFGLWHSAGTSSGRCAASAATTSSTPRSPPHHPCWRLLRTGCKAWLRDDALAHPAGLN